MIPRHSSINGHWRSSRPQAAMPGNAEPDLRLRKRKAGGQTVNRAFATASMRGRVSALSGMPRNRKKA